MMLIIYVFAFVFLVAASMGVTWPRLANLGWFELALWLLAEKILVAAP